MTARKRRPMVQVPLLPPTAAEVAKLKDDLAKASVERLRAEQEVALKDSALKAAKAVKAALDERIAALTKTLSEA